MKAIAYIRMASNDQADQYEVGNFPQEKTIKNYCYLNNIIFLETFYDVGVSGSNFDREGWRQMEAFLGEYAVDLVIVTDYNRISRDIQMVQAKMAEIEETYGPQVLALSNPIIPSSDDLADLFKQ
jgi:DNA invertase Pin-like site-specific DNA recombinase